MKHPRFLALAALLGCAAPSAPQVQLNGAGATFPNIIYQKWMLTFNQANATIQLNYQSIGSGGGIRQFSDGTVDFGGTDAPMSDSAIAAIQGNVLHIPTVLGAIVATYNLPGVTEPVKFTPDVLADIFLGKITKWNDTRIASLNAGLKLPASDILVVHRSDGSGTTYIFTDYLAAVSPDWSTIVGKGKEVKWPVGLGAKGNEGVAGQVKQTPGSIGYTELTYARQNKLPYAHVQNAAGKFVEPTIESITAAAAGVKLPPTTDYRVSIVNAAGADAYPISSFTWLLVYRTQTDPTKGKKLKDFMRWFYAEGQKSAPALDYGPLPAALTKRLMARLDSIQVSGTK